MDLAQVADELYGLAPAQFRAARDERAGQARAAGDRKLAAAIAKLRRPTVSAWLVNQLARKAGDDLGRLLELGSEMREAQQALAGGRLRELSSRRRSEVAALVRRAKRLAAEAGQATGAQVEREVAATLEAALADREAADAVRSGHLTGALSHVGLGGPGLAVAPPPATGRPAAAAGRPARGAKVPAPGKTGSQARHLRVVREDEAARRPQQAASQAAAAQRRAREAAAERDVRDAAELASQASAELDQAERRAAAAHARRDALRREREQLEKLMAAVQAEEAGAARDIRLAQQDRESASRALAAAQRRLLRARSALRKLRER